jgi:hypothetical protein
VPNELATPPSVLTERKDLGKEVVTGGKAIEEIRREGVFRAGGRRLVRSHHESG